MTNPSVSLADRIRDIPPVTRFFTISTVFVCFADALKLFNVTQLLCYLDVFTVKSLEVRKAFNSGVWTTLAFAILDLVFQSYRFLSAFLVPVGILLDNRLQAIFDVYFFYTFANHLESYEGKFRRNFPDCLWFTLLSGTVIVFTSFAYQFFDPSHFPAHHQMMLSCVTYIWSRSLKNSIINFLGVFPIKAYYLPLFNLFVKLLIGGYSFTVDSIIGIFGGYMYQCFQSDTLPFYNLLPGSYNLFLTSNNTGRRVGNIYMSATENMIEDSIFDKGYLKAPVWLYKLLDYPISNSKRTTAFENKKAEQFGTVHNLNTLTATTTGASWFSYDSAFKGKGHRLGD